ncbi:MAG: hypothetical protein WHT08_15595 [Bryobacteraceae bacterium]|jgi:hypothetical protein
MKRLLFWEFPRASWQYDLVVALILAFIFLTPRSFFKDQPRPASIVQMPSEAGATVYWFETSLLQSLPGAQRPAEAAELLRKRLGKNVSVVRVEPIHDPEGEIRGYIALSKP